MIPFSPPRIDEKTIASVTEALQSGWITTGPKTKLFEEDLASYLGLDEVVCVNSATAGLQLILKWLDIGPGDEVIVPAYTYCATANVVVHCGATPVMVDVNEDDFNISIAGTKSAITNRTKAIISVDIAGLPVDYEALMNLVDDPEIRSMFSPKGNVQQKFGRIALISDAAHSVGAKYKGKYTGNHADMTSYSFHAVKNLTTAEGGAVAFNVKDKFDQTALKKSFKTSSLHGQTKDAFSKTQVGAWRYDVVEAGFKCNMTDLQAAIGLVELERYDETLERRKEICELYLKGFEGSEWAMLPTFQTSEKSSSYHLFMLRIKGCAEEQRDAIIAEISKCDVAVNVHFLPLPMLTFYRDRGYDIKDYPVSYANFKSEISLPVYFDLTNDEVDEVISTVKSAVNKILN